MREKPLMQWQMVTMWIVLNPDDTYAGTPCQTWEEARELTNAAEGRRCFLVTDEMEVNEDTHWLYKD